MRRISDRRDALARKVRAAGMALVVLAALAVAYAVMTPDADDAPSPGRSPETTDASEPPAAPLDIEQEAELVSGFIYASSSGWAAHVTEADVSTVLARPVVTVVTDLSAEDVAATEEFLVGLGEFLTASAEGKTYHVRVLSAEGELVGSFSRKDVRWKLETPPAPTDAEALIEWLTGVYGSSSAPEPWLDRIETIQDPSADPEGYLVIRTHLDPTEPADTAMAQTIIDAVNSSGAIFAPGIRVLFQEPGFEWTSLLDGKDPYAPS